MSARPSRSTSALALLGLLALAGCGGSKVVALGDLRAHGQLDLFLGSTSLAPDAQGMLSVELLDATQPCPVLADEVVATLDGQPLKVLSRGGSSTELTGPGREVLPKRCVSPAFAVGDRAHPLGDTEQSSFMLTDGTTQLRFVVAHPFAARGMSWVDPAGGQLRAGERAVLGPEPATDAFRCDFVDFSPAAPDGGAATTGESATTEVLEDGGMALTVPALDETAGSAVCVSPFFQARVVACEGVGSCAVTLAVAGEVSAPFVRSQ